MTFETKINEIFPKANVLIEEFSTSYRLDRDSKGWRIMLYVIVDIPSNLLAFEDKPIKSLFISLNLQNIKIIINCSYNPYEYGIKKRLTALRNSVSLNSSEYEKILILGDFSVNIKEAKMESFCENYNLKILTK